MITKRFGFKMKILPGFKDEYIKKHFEIWPELVLLLKNVRNTEIVQKRWKYMADIMKTNPDNSPDTTPLEQVFHME